MGPFQLNDVPPENYGPAIELIVAAVGAFLVVYLVGRWLVVPTVTGVVRARNRRNTTLVGAVNRYARLTTLVVALVAAVIVAGFGYLLSGSAIVFAAVTLAIGVAGQDVIGNLVSGLFLVTDPEFNVDDWIAWDDREGTVEAIRFRVTRVRTPNDEVITVPNTTLATTAVIRPYSRNRYRVVVRIPVDIGADVEAVIAVIRAEMVAIDGVLDDPPPAVAVEELDSEGIRLRAQFWIPQPSRRDVARVRSTYVRRVKKRLQSQDIDLSPPSEHVLSGRIEVVRPEEDADAT